MDAAILCVACPTLLACLACPALLQVGLRVARQQCSLASMVMAHVTPPTYVHCRHGTPPAASGCWAAGWGGTRGASAGFSCGSVPLRGSMPSGGPRRGRGLSVSSFKALRYAGGSHCLPSLIILATPWFSVVREGGGRGCSAFAGCMHAPATGSDQFH